MPGRFILLSLDAVPGYAQRSLAGSREATIILCASVLAIAAYWVALYLWGLFRKPAAPAAQAGLFDELARVHNLTKADQVLLRRVAAGAAYPSVVFVDPGLFDRFAATRPSDAPACSALKERLFGS